MKALSTTILIVVTAVVILVAALVVLTIFGGGIGNVSTLTNVETQCRTQCAVTCKMGGLPPTWDIKQKVGNDQKSCRDLVGDCSACGGTSTTPGSSDTLTGCCKYGSNCLVTTKPDCDSKGGGFSVGNWKCDNNKNCVSS